MRPTGAVKVFEKGNQWVSAAGEESFEKKGRSNPSRSFQNNKTTLLLSSLRSLLSLSLFAPLHPYPWGRSAAAGQVAL